MIELNGKYNSAKIFTDMIDQSAIAQIIELLNQQFTQNEKIRIMPDVHAGAGCVIGTTMTITNKIVPNLVGVDIGCGMETVKINEKNVDFEQLDRLIHDKIPAGAEIKDTPLTYFDGTDISEMLSKLKCIKNVNIDRAVRSIGTLGGGNHFIEVNHTGASGDFLENNDEFYIVIHSGSRHLGVEVAKYYQNMGYKQLSSVKDSETAKLIADLKSQGRQTEISEAIKKLKETKQISVPEHLAYVEGELFYDYLHDMAIVQKFADLNRKAMMAEIITGMNFTVAEQFTTIHNYIDIKHMILRKGSVSAQENEKLIIPINMRDGSLICTGKGNFDWNFSAPHGAGRLMSRKKAKDTLTVAEFKRQMDGIYSSSVCYDTIDESPMAYKNIDDIINNISDTVEIEAIIKPVYNFKAGGL